MFWAVRPFARVSAGSGGQCNSTNPHFSIRKLLRSTMALQTTIRRRMAGKTSQADTQKWPDKSDDIWERGNC